MINLGLLMCWLEKPKANQRRGWGHLRAKNVLFCWFVSVWGFHCSPFASAQVISRRRVFSQRSKTLVNWLFPKLTGKWGTFTPSHSEFNNIFGLTKSQKITVMSPFLSEFKVVHPKGVVLLKHTHGRSWIAAWTSKLWQLTPYLPNIMCLVWCYNSACWRWTLGAIFS